MFEILISVIQVVSATTQKDNVSLMFYKQIYSLLELPQTIDDLLLQNNKKSLADKSFECEKNTILVQTELYDLKNVISDVITNLEIKIKYAFDFLSGLDHKTDEQCMELLRNRLKLLVDFSMRFNKSSSFFIDQEMILPFDILGGSNYIVYWINEFKARFNVYFTGLRDDLMQLLLDIVCYNTLSLFRASEYVVLMESAFKKTLIENLPPDDVLKECFVRRYSDYMPIHLSFSKMLNVCNVFIDENIRDLCRRYVLEFRIEVMEHFNMCELTNGDESTYIIKLTAQMLPLIKNKMPDVQKCDEKYSELFIDACQVFEKRIEHNFHEFIKGLLYLLQQLRSTRVLDVEELYHLVDVLLQNKSNELNKFSNEICIIHHSLILTILQGAVDDRNFENKCF